MASNPGMGIGSYDRLFPSQAVMPSGGFRNLIAQPRKQDHSPGFILNSVFLQSTGHEAFRFGGSGAP